jgi:type IV pilus assembly protein PilY1
MRSHHVFSHRKSFFALTLGLTLLGGLSTPFTPEAKAQTAPLMVYSLLAAAPAAAATVASGAVELSPTPPNDTQAVAPNIMVTFDDSGSMASNYMGDDRPYDNGSWAGPWRCASVVDPDHPTATDKALRALAMNGVYYNPNITYKPPVKADGTSFDNVPLDASGQPTAVWVDGITVKRPRGGVTADATTGYYNNPQLDSPSSGAVANLMGLLTSTTSDVTKTFTGSACPASGIDSNSCICIDKKSNGACRSNNNSWQWTVTTQKTVTTDNRWKCGTGNGSAEAWSAGSPMDNQSHTLSDGTTSNYPNGGPYYYRLKAGVVVNLNSQGSPATAADRTALYTAANWEAVPVSTAQYQNFANWYAYYRTRNQMARSAMSRVFGALGGQTTDGGFGSTVRAAWQNLNAGTYKLPATSVISNLIDTAACTGAAGADPSTIQAPTNSAVPDPCYRSAFFNWIFQTPASGGTPSVNAADRAGKFFQRGGSADANQADNFKTLRDPYWEAGKILPDGTQAAGAELYCRQNFHMLVTDGLFNENSISTSSVATLPQNSVTLPDNTPFAPTASYNAIFQGQHSNNGSGGTEASLSDVAFNYWATNLRPDLYNAPNGMFVPPYMPDKTTGIVATTDISAAGPNNAHVNNEIYFNPKNDPANWPHLVQYLVGLGVSGVLNYSDDTDCSVSTSSDACLLRKGSTNSSASIGWPQPSDPTPGIAKNIDDTWHAAIASRGDFFNAGNPQNLVDQLSTILTNISARTAPATTGAVNTSVLVPGALGFSTGYSSANWSGSMQAVGVNADGTTTTSSLWDAGNDLDDPGITHPTTRKIFTAKESAGSFDGGVEFKTFTDLDTIGQALLSDVPASSSSTNDTGQTRIDYLRGDRSKEGTTFRTREHLLGAIIGSQPVYVSYPASGYRNSWPTGSPEQDANDNDASDCSTSSTCSSYEYFVKNHLTRTPTVYVGANDGMLHAFDASEYNDTSVTPNVIKPTTGAGLELFAYVPRSTYANLGNLTAKDNFQFRPTVDGIPVTRDVFFGAATTTPVTTLAGWHTILVGGLRLGGRGVYALDITEPGAMSAGKVLWEFNADQADQAAWSDGTNSNPGGQPSNLGYTFGQPNIGRLNNGKWVVLVPGGYFPDCSKPPFTAANCSYPAAASNKFSSLFVLDAQTGKLIRELRTPDPATVTGAVASHGLSSPVLGDYNDDQIDDVAFAGDLDGNLWRYDLTSSDPNGWSISLAYQPATAGAQPITSMPRLFGDPVTNKFIVVFGTGKYLGASDNTSGSAAVQAVYGIRDTGSTVVIGDLVQQTLSEKLADDGLTLARGLTNYPVPSSNGGWYFNLGPSSSSAGERVVVTPGALFDTGRVVIQTLIPGTNDPCSASIQGAIMVVNAATGGSDGGLSGPGVNGWGGTGAGDTSTVGGRVNNPRTTGTVPLVSTIGGGTVLIPGLELSGSGEVLDINDAIWRRRSWRALNNDQ